MERLYELITSHEDWLLDRVLDYAKKHNYVKYTSTLREAWRMSIAGLSERILAVLRDNTQLLELGPDTDYNRDVIASYGILQARKHRERGVELGMFFGLLKYYRQSYVDLVLQAGLEQDCEKHYCLLIGSFFDRLEVGLCAEWGKVSQDSLIRELQTGNRAMTNEKNKFLTVYESLPNPVILLDSQNRVDIMNLAAAELFQDYCTPGVCYYGPGSDIETIPWLANELAVFSGSNEQEAILEKKIDTRRGTFYFEIKLKQMLDISEKFTGTVVILNDITKRKKAEEAAEHINEELNQIFNTAAGGMRVIDKNFNVLRINDTFANLAGLSPEEAAGKKCYEMFRGSFCHTPDCPLARIISGDERVEYDMEKERRDGVKIPCIVTATPFLAPSGELLGIVEDIRDISERKQAEDRIRRNAERAETLAQISQELSVVGLEYEAVLDTVVQKVAGLIGDACVVNMLSDDGQWLKPVAFYHPNPRALDLLRNILTGPALRADEEPFNRVILTGRQLLIQGVSVRNSGVFAGPEFSPYLDEVGLQSILIAPLRVKGGVIGTLVVARDKHGQPYNTEEQSFLQNLADRIALTITNARLYEKARRRLKQVHALRKIDMAIAANLKMNAIFEVILDQVVAQLDVDAADILQLHKDTQTLEYAAGRGFRGKSIEQSRLRLGEGYASQVILENRIIHIPNLAEVRSTFLRTPLLEGEDFITYIGVPLVAKGEVMGLLEIYHRAPLDPDTEWLEYLETLAGQASIAIDNAALFSELQRSNDELKQAYDATIRGWAYALDLRDKETEGHSQRVTEMTLRLARAIGMSEEELVYVRWGALLHDIGKMGVPDHILLKPGSLTEEEWAIMKRHPEYAYEMLIPISYLQPALNIPYCHHEKWDGTGYPRGLKGEEIPLEARIFAIVDVWDALCSDRPYRPAMPENKAFDYIRGQAGKHFDPKVVELFLGLMSKKNGSV
ncbi:HD domain-containing phosphohydrolase [Desulfolucanica intricata]|uniref:HD domain-containing phosphohydrolase n=1 Tax=Desulfolucanica intricata TaxID=1285191 RepID=UPI00082E1850|nr:HD domain-containing phosphohydrolase [Desulfolucanica intricata]